MVAYARAWRASRDSCTAAAARRMATLQERCVLGPVTLLQEGRWTRLLSAARTRSSPPHTHLQRPPPPLTARRCWQTDPPMVFPKDEYGLPQMVLTDLHRMSSQGMSSSVDGSACYYHGSTSPPNYYDCVYGVKDGMNMDRGGFGHSQYVCAPWSVLARPAPLVRVRAGQGSLVVTGRCPSAFNTGTRACPCAIAGAFLSPRPTAPLMHLPARLSACLAEPAQTLRPCLMA